MDADTQFLYLTTTGRKTGLPREIEIWFVQDDGRFYILAEHGYKAHWVQNILINPRVHVRIGGQQWDGLARVLDPDRDVLRCAAVYWHFVNAAALVVVGTQLSASV